MPLCPCGSTLQFDLCCGPYINAQTNPKTPEALMRSRYTAYSLSNIDYIKKTMRGKPLLEFNEQEAKLWSQSVVWLGLKVLNSNQTAEDQGFVTFSARFLDKNSIKTIQEVSQFQVMDGQWFYTDGEQTYIPSKIISRNAPCPCGSKKKFKNCHGKS